MKCDICDGTGRASPDFKTKCASCSGTGVLNEEVSSLNDRKMKLYSLKLLKARKLKSKDSSILSGYIDRIEKKMEGK